jgi:predicted NAD-dependent protein-ADP-ribosyltransferase YbiA (DUF1768 family)
MSFVLPNLTGCVPTDDIKASEFAFENPESIAFISLQFLPGLRNDYAGAPFLASLPLPSDEITTDVLEKKENWPTVDHYLYASLYKNSEAQNYVRGLPWDQLKYLVPENDANAVDMIEWRQYLPTLLHDALIYKFSQNYPLLIQLIQTGSSQLADEDETMSKFFGRNVTQNSLGVTLSIVRDELSRM